MDNIKLQYNRECRMGVRIHGFDGQNIRKVKDREGLFVEVSDYIKNKPLTINSDGYGVCSNTRGNRKKVLQGVESKLFSISKSDYEKLLEMRKQDEAEEKVIEEAKEEQRAEAAKQKEDEGFLAEPKPEPEMVGVDDGEKSPELTFESETPKASEPKPKRELKKDAKIKLKDK